MTLPVKGVYDDYGAVRDVEDTPLTRFQVGVLSHFAKGPFESEPEPQTIEDWCSLCERDELRIEADYSVVGKLVRKTIPFIVREEVYQTLIASPGEGVGTSRPRVEAYVGEEPTSSVRIAAEHAKRKQDEDDWSDMSPEVRDALKRTYDLFDRMGDLAFRRELDFLVCGADEVQPSSFASLLEFVDDDWQTLDGEIVDFITFRANLRECRREFMPALYRDQTYGPENPTVANEKLADLIGHMWGPALRKKLEIEDD